ncbi:glycosyltransferase family 1 protein [Lactobacillus acidophilus]|uniref:glycosyltransferase family 4 protein n=1 Tax=Lactobacillus acidophilus TaxID=1579 RepID=UPI000F764BB8|nr:glycosyltransferase family 4 protein [Lactobacillus acidophilus]AZN77300.1 glycosyltransferase family 1 protein [Lactobacillus acidophilus]
MNKKKLAIISTGFMPVPAVKGGAIEQLIEYFIDGNELEHKYDIDLYTVNDKLLNDKKYNYTNLIKIDNKQNKWIWHFIYGVKNKFSAFLRREKTYSYVRDRIVKKYKRNYYDVILVENNMDLYKELYPKLTHEKIYFHLHNNVDCGDKAKTKKKTSFILNTADEIWVVSNFLRKRLLRIDSNKKTDIKVVYNGIISDDFKQLNEVERKKVRNKLGIKDTKIVFTFVGRLCNDKGIDKFIQAMQLLKNRKDIEYIVVGNNFFGTSSEDTYIKKLKKLAKGLENKIHFTGYIDNKKLYKIYSVSDVVVIPTQVEETFSVVALEAMTMGLPVIASVSGGLQEVLSSKCSLSVKRDGDFVKKLSDAILLLSINSQLRGQLGIEGKKRSKVFPNSEKEYFYLLSSKIN